MARTMKKEMIQACDEKMARTLVPETEHPYQLPPNWHWVKLQSIAKHISDGSHNPPKDAGVGIPLLSATNVHDRIIDFESASRWITDEEWSLENERTKIEKGDVLLTIVATLGRVAVVKTDRQFALQRSVAVIKPKIDATYLSYFLESPYVQAFMNTNAKGTAQKGFYLNALQSLYCAISPDAEQKRIVDRIESLFAKLDEAKEKAQAVVDGYEDRKAAILHKAFTGELTEKWRKKNEYLMSTEIVTIASVCHSLKYGTAKKSSSEGNVAVIRMGNLQHGEIVWTNLAYTNDEDDIKKYALSEGDVLFNRTNSPDLVGKTAIYRGEYPAIYAGYLIKLEYDRTRVSGEYLNYVLNTQEAKEYCNAVKTDGVNQSNINAKKIGEFAFLLPPIEEQRVCVEILNRIIKNEKETKEAAEQVIAQIDSMKKAILARAFRGELGTNDPSEEPVDIGTL